MHREKKCKLFEIWDNPEYDDLECNMDCLHQATSLICIKEVKSPVLDLTHSYWEILEGIETVNTKNAKFN